MNFILPDTRHGKIPWTSKLKIVIYCQVRTGVATRVLRSSGPWIVIIVEYHVLPCIVTSNTEYYIIYNQYKYSVFPDGNQFHADIADSIIKVTWLM